MEVTQETVLSLLLNEGGKMRRSDFQNVFKGSINCSDPAGKIEKRELLKTFIDNVAVMKEIEGVKCIVVKKKYQHLIKEKPDSTLLTQKHEEAFEQGVEQHSPGQDKKHRAQFQDGGCRTAEQSLDSGVSELVSNDNEDPSPIQLALNSIQDIDITPKRSLNFSIVQSAKEANPSWDILPAAKTETTGAHKPYALPLRMPPTQYKVKLKDGFPVKATSESDNSSSKNKKLSYEDGSQRSPQLNRANKMADGPKSSEAIVFDRKDHEWLVRTASGHWSQVYGLLLQDTHLAEKRDFMSGFTALHWAVKCGNREMVSKIIDIARLGGAEVDVNARSHGGYTPLHIAALHNQEPMMILLVNTYGANRHARDNWGKKPYHYLRGEASAGVRELLGGAHKEAPQEGEEVDQFAELPKGLNTISRLFQPYAAAAPPKKKPKQRAGFLSLSEECRDEANESEPKHRALSQVIN